MYVPFDQVIASHSSTYEADDVFLIMTGSGSGLSLLLFSLWVRNRVPEKVPEKDFRKVFNGVRLGIVLAFAFTLFIIVGLMIISLGHRQWQHVRGPPGRGLGSLLLGPELFLFATFLMMFCAVLIGADGRARAITGMLRRAGGAPFGKGRPVQGHAGGADEHHRADHPAGPPGRRGQLHLRPLVCDIRRDRLLPGPT